jgi:electron-transferring-flavoprotein dehydrogenase
MLAAETIAEALRAGRCDRQTLSAYDRKYRESWLHDELRRVRNVRQAFAGNFFTGAIRAGVMLFTGGRIIADRLPVKADPAHMEKLAARGDAAGGHSQTASDGRLTFDKVTGVYHAGAMHEENQPSHLVVQDLDICRTRCREEYGNPCESFCPAAVYEMVDDLERPPLADGSRTKRLHINHSNCVHCKTCDVMDPYGIITWTVPADAGGPKYVGM